MSTHANRVKMTVTSVDATPSTGLGAITLNAASTGFRSFATAYSNANATVDILITEGTAWEIARNCTYTHSGTTVSRGTLENSSTGIAVVFTSAAVVSVIATAGFGNAVDNALGAWGALNGENSITTTATAVIGRLNVCSGTSANYTVTLPALSGSTSAPKYLGLQMAAALTKLITIEGSGSETIDGALNRIMWAGETALLRDNGATWTKMAGKSIAFTAGIYLATTQTSVTASSVEKILCTTLDFDVSGLIADTTNSRLTVPRPGIYAMAGKVQGEGPGALDRWLSLLYVDGSQVGSGECSSTSDGYPTPAAVRTQALTAGHQIELKVYFSGATAKNVAGSAGKETQINIAEVVTW